MKVIEYFRSGSGSTKFNHLIYNDNVSVKSMSSLVLLNQYYRERDIDLLNEMKEIQDYLNRRTIFLLKEKKKHGDLVCHYCGKPHLEVGYRHHSLSNLNNKNLKLATIDHVIPVSDGIDKLDESNWVVSCKKCNGKKGSRDYNEFKNSIKKAV